MLAFNHKPLPDTGSTGDLFCNDAPGTYPHNFGSTQILGRQIQRNTDPVVPRERCPDPAVGKVRPVNHMEWLVKPLDLSMHSETAVGGPPIKHCNRLF
jgi:hypothetical protein